MQQMNTDGHPVWLLASQEKALYPALYMVAGEDEAEALEAMQARFEQAVENGECRAFALAAFSVPDWNRDLTPWPAPSLFKKTPDFAGEAEKTLAWLNRLLIPTVEASGWVQPGVENRCLMGYSLGGLFSAWACYEQGGFGGFASCSGSLWYDGWTAYVQDRTLPPEVRRVYLSLGDREGKARNQRMASVEPATLAMAEKIAGMPSVESTFTWQAGGHFDGVADRLSDAAIWLMR